MNVVPYYLDRCFICDQVWNVNNCYAVMGNGLFAYSFIEYILNNCFQLFSVPKMPWGMAYWNTGGSGAAKSLWILEGNDKLS